jgi:hypothetical protein
MRVSSGLAVLPGWRWRRQGCSWGGVGFGVECVRIPHDEDASVALQGGDHRPLVGEGIPPGRDAVVQEDLGIGADVERLPPRDGGGRPVAVRPRQQLPLRQVIADAVE